VTRRRLAGLLLSAWVLTLGWLVQRHYFRSTGARLAEAALAIPPGAIYYRLTLGDAAIGFASTTIDTLADSIRVDDVLVLDAAALGQVHRTTARSTAIVGRTLRLRSLTLAFDGDGGGFAARGAVAGDSVLRLELVSRGDSDVARVRVDRAPVVPSLLAMRTVRAEAVPESREARRLAILEDTMRDCMAIPPKFPEYPACEDALWSALREALLGKLEPDAALREAAEAVRRAKNGKQRK